MQPEHEHLFEQWITHWNDLVEFEIIPVRTSTDAMKTILPQLLQAESAECQYREATLNDIPALSHIRLSVKENMLSDPSRITREMYEDYLIRHGRGWLGEINGKVVGFSIASEPDSSIWALFMLKEYEGRGIAKTLLKLAVNWLAEQGKEHVHLSTTANTRADQFYQRQGWIRGELKPDGEVPFVFRLTRQASVDMPVPTSENDRINPEQ
jgi:GNAT superfamily N-acetyltransferase